MSAAQFSQAAVSKQRVALMIWPEFYLKAIPTLVGAWMLPVTLVGIICSLKKRRYRWDSVRVVLASVLTLSLLQCIWAKDARYLLWACPVATWFIAHAFFAAIRCELFSLNRSRVWTIAVVGLMGLAIYLTAINQQNPRKSVTGFSEVAEHMMKIAGGEPILYHGTYDGTFVFHTRSLDERFRQQVVLVRKLPMGMGQSVETNVLHWRRGKSRD